MSSKRKILLFLVAILWICKPVPYQQVGQKKIPPEVVSLRSGAQNPSPTDTTDILILLEEKTTIRQNYFDKQKELEFHQRNFERFQQLNNIKDDNLNLLELSPIQENLYRLYRQRFLDTREKILEYDTLYSLKAREIHELIQPMSAEQKKELKIFLRNLKPTSESKYDLIQSEIHLVISQLSP